MMQNLARMAPDGPGNSVVEGKTSSGTPYITYGNSFQFDPKATGEMRADTQKEMEQYKFTLRQQLHEQMINSGLNQAKDQKGNVIPGLYLRPDGKTVDMRDMFQKAGLENPNAPTPAQSPSARPAGNTSTNLLNVGKYRVRY
jgi:hypothetical protein